MIDLEQEVEVRWGGFKKPYYESLGYKYTGMGEPFYVKANHLTPSSTAIVKVQCDDCGAETSMSYEHYNRIVTKTGAYYCPSCSNERINAPRREQSFQKYLEFCKQRNYTPLSKFEDYKNKSTKLYYLCPIHGEQWTTTGSIISNKDFSCGCKLCANKIIGDKRRKTKEEIIELVESKNGNQLLNPDDYIDMNTNNMIIKCGSCGNIFTKALNTNQKSDYLGLCPDCRNKFVAEKAKLSIKELKKEYTKNGKMYLLNPEDYINSSERNLRFICKDCGKEFITNRHYYNQSNGRCPNCIAELSKNEAVIRDFLIDNNIDFIVHYPFLDCRDIFPLPFDFYISSMNTCIEYDGEQHYFPIFGDESFVKGMKHDKIKNEYCKDKGIKLIRIPYWRKSEIPSILKEELNI